MGIAQRAGLVLLTAAIAACSGGGDGSGLAPTAAPGAPVGGVPVKGPLANAALEGFELDVAAEHGEGALADTGFTDAQAQIQDLNLLDTKDYIVQVSATADTRDLSTGAAPLLAPLRTLIRAEQITAGAGIYPSPATTAVIALADALGDVNEANLAEARDRLLPVILPGILPADADFFAIAPLVTDNATEVIGKESLIVNFRLFSEALVALLQEMADSDASIADVNAAFAVFIADLADDGDLQSAQGLNAAQNDPKTIPLPGRPGETLADVTNLLLNERSDTGLIQLTVNLPQPEPEEGVETRPDNDADGVPNHVDNCMDTANADQANFDEDAQGDACDSDDDNDGLADSAEISTNPKDPDSDDDGALDGADNCPLTGPNDQTDTDQDGAGNVCDDDDDNDGSSDAEEAERGTNPLVADTDDDGATDPNDNCPLTGPNDQTDTDSDGQGDVCDNDDDNDGLSDAQEQSLGTNPLIADTDEDSVNDGADNCPLTSHPDQTDTDSDGAGDPCDADDDNDGLNDDQETVTNPKDPDTDDDGALDGADNCPLTGPNDQTDTDGDGDGNVCDDDDDNDGLKDVDETETNPLNPDTDSDGVGDATDNCPVKANADQGDADTDGQGDACDNDDDNDGLSDAEEAELGTNPLNGDSDSDGVGDASDNCPVDANGDQADNDTDGRGDVCDSDDDNDGSSDAEEAQRNTDPFDADSDDDGAQDGADNCPLTGPNDQSNNDGDTEGDICDTDDDNDGVEDGADNCPLNANSTQSDFDGDGKGDACDTDRDNDGIDDVNDECPVTPEDQRGQINAQGCGPDEIDTDEDGLFDPEDNCPAVPNPGQENNDGDAQGDVCDNDDDNDGVDDGADNCPLNENSDQTNTDGDSFGNVCDDDDDGDNVVDGQDNCPLIQNSGQEDQDQDGVGDACDSDVDGDGLDGQQEAELGTDPNKADTDGDGSNDNVDNCPINSNPQQVDTDKDGAGNLCDPDDDNDGLTDVEENERGSDPFKADTDDDTVGDAADNCPADANSDQADFDQDNKGDVCDADDDNDGLSDIDEANAGTNPKDVDSDDDTVEDGADNCPLTGPADQTDTDEDGQGDLCDEDIDGDSVNNDVDNCPNDANNDQANFDNDAQGDACDSDIDNDNLEEPADICPNTPEDERGDIDADGCGPSELDSDNDGLNNAEDNCPQVANPNQENLDGDDFGDACDDDKDGDTVNNDVDNCPDVSNEDQLNSDNADDGGNACDNDDDNDERFDSVDNCPLIHNTDQADQDGDGKGDVCDTDRDGDGVDNSEDNCPFDANEDQADADNDGLGDICDNDADNDRVDDSFDNCPGLANPDQVDTDQDGEGNACDTNDDNDARDDTDDNCPLVENDDQANFDGDDQGDACDADDDNDGFDDGQDVCPFTPEGDTPDSVGCGPNDVPASGSGTFHSSEMTRSLFGGNPQQSVEWGFFEAVDNNGFVVLTSGQGNQRKDLFSAPRSADSSERDARRDSATGALQRLGNLDLNVDEEDLESEEAGLFIGRSHWMQPMPGRMLVGDRLSAYLPLSIDSVDSIEESRTLGPRFNGNSVEGEQWVLAPISADVDETILPSRLGLVTVSTNGSHHRFGLSEFNINPDGSASESSFRTREFFDNGTCCSNGSDPSDALAEGAGNYRGPAVDVLFDVADSGTGAVTLQITDGSQNPVDEKIGFIGAGGASMLLRQTDADPLNQMGHSFGLPLPAADQTPSLEGRAYRISGTVSGMNSIGVVVMRGMQLSLEAGNVARLTGEEGRNIERLMGGFGPDSLEGLVLHQGLNDSEPAGGTLNVTGSWSVEAGGRVRIDFPDVMGEQVAADGFVNADGDALALAWMATLPGGGWNNTDPANASGLVLGSADMLPPENVAPQVTSITTNGLGENFIAEEGETLPLLVSTEDADSDAIEVEWQTYFGSFSDGSQANTVWTPEPNEDDNTLLIVGVNDGTDGAFGVVGVWGGEMDREGTTTEQFRAVNVFEAVHFDAEQLQDLLFIYPHEDPSSPIECDAGTASRNFSDNNNDGVLNAGDTLDLVFDQCQWVEGEESETLDGRLMITVLAGDFESGDDSRVAVEFFDFSDSYSEAFESETELYNGRIEQEILSYTLDSEGEYDALHAKFTVPSNDSLTVDVSFASNRPNEDEEFDERRLNFHAGCAIDVSTRFLSPATWSLDIDCTMSVAEAGSNAPIVTARYQTGPDGAAIGGPIEFFDRERSFIIENGDILIDVSVYDGQPVSDFSLSIEFDDNGFLEYFAQTAGDEPYVIDAFDLGEIFDIADDGLDLWPQNPNLNGEVHRFAGLDLEFSVFPNTEDNGGTKQASGIIFERGQFGLNVPAQEANFEFETIGGPVIGRGSDPNNLFVFYEEYELEEDSLLDVLLDGPSVAFTGVGLDQSDGGEFDKPNGELFDDHFLGVTSTSRKFSSITADFGLTRIGVTERDAEQRINPDDLIGDGLEVESSVGGRVVNNLMANQLPAGDVGVIFLYAEMDVQYWNNTRSYRELCAGIGQLNLDGNAQFTQAERGREPCVIYEEEGSDSELIIELPQGNDDPDARPSGGLSIVDSENGVVELRTDFVDWDAEYGYSLIESEGGLFNAVANGELYLGTNDESVAYLVPYSAGTLLGNGSWRVNLSAIGMGDSGFNTLFVVNNGSLSVSGGVPTLQGTVTVANRETERSEVDSEQLELNLTGTMTTGDLGEVIIEFPDEFLTLSGFVTTSGELAVGKVMRYENGVDELALGLWNAMQLNADSESAVADQEPSVELELLVNGVAQTTDADGFYNLDSGSVIQINVTSADPEGDTISYSYRVTDGLLDQADPAEDFNGDVREDATDSQTWSLPNSDGSALLIVEARAGVKAGTVVVPVRWSAAP